MGWAGRACGCASPSAGGVSLLEKFKHLLIISGGIDRGTIELILQSWIGACFEQAFYQRIVCVAHGIVKRSYPILFLCVYVRLSVDEENGKLRVLMVCCVVKRRPPKIVCDVQIS